MPIHSKNDFMKLDNAVLASRRSPHREHAFRAKLHDLISIQLATAC